jgi:hypothetical protein
VAGEEERGEVVSRRRDPEAAIARKAKRAGITKAKYLELRSDAMRRSAISQGWSRVELALSLADIEQIAARVWPARG